MTPRGPVIAAAFAIAALPAAAHAVSCPSETISSHFINLPSDVGVTACIHKDKLMGMQSVDWILVNRTDDVLNVRFTKRYVLSCGKSESHGANVLLQPNATAWGTNFGGDLDLNTPVDVGSACGKGGSISRVEVTGFRIENRSRAQREQEQKRQAEQQRADEQRRQDQAERERVRLQQEADRQQRAQEAAEARRQQREEAQAQRAQDAARRREEREAQRLQERVQAIENARQRASTAIDSAARSIMDIFQQQADRDEAERERRAAIDQEQREREEAAEEAREEREAERRAEEAEQRREEARQREEERRERAIRQQEMVEDVTAIFAAARESVPEGEGPRPRERCDAVQRMANPSLCPPEGEENVSEQPAIPGRRASCDAMQRLANPSLCPPEAAASPPAPTAGPAN